MADEQFYRNDALRPDRTVWLGVAVAEDNEFAVDVRYSPVRDPRVWVGWGTADLRSPSALRNGRASVRLPATAIPGLTIARTRPGVSLSDDEVVIATDGRRFVFVRDDQPPDSVFAARELNLDEAQRDRVGRVFCDDSSRLFVVEYGAQKPKLVHTGHMDEPLGTLPVTHFHWEEAEGLLYCEATTLRGKLSWSKDTTSGSDDRAYDPVWEPARGGCIGLHERSRLEHDFALDGPAVFVTALGGGSRGVVGVVPDL